MKQRFDDTLSREQSRLAREHEEVRANAYEYSMQTTCVTLPRAYTRDKYIVFLHMQSF